jgi:succinate dehydrogenase / fumarate reductase flavoprotein subunit
MYVAAWEYISDHQWQLHKEELQYDEVKPTQRSYK